VTELQEAGVSADEIYTPEFSTDPYPTYHRLRELAPVCPVRAPRFDSYLITRYDDARAALSDPRLSKDLYGGDEIGKRIFGPNSAAINKNMLNSDPPEHTRLRRLVAQAFTPHRIEALRPRIAAVVDGLVDGLVRDGAGATDLIPGFALPLPVTVICDLLGVPRADRERFTVATQVIRTAGTAGRSPLEDRERIQAAQADVFEYLTRFVAYKRTEPGADLMSELIAARDDDDALSERELVSTVFLLLFAGHQTTSDFVGNAVLALLTHPDQLARLRADPALVPAAVEELLRLDGSVPVASPRVATEDVEYGGVTIPRGAIVTVVLNAANHDPEHFPDPEGIHIDRVGRTHIAFGFGVHYCLGVSLARAEAQIALETLLRRLPGLRLAVPVAEIRHLPGASPFRGLLGLPVRFDTDNTDTEDSS
jgi:cytochrome P450